MQKSTRLRVESLDDRIVPATFTVTNAGDTATPGDLRDAITQALANPGPDVIQFNIFLPPPTPPFPISIVLQTPLPIFTGVNNGIFIDGTTQTGFAVDPVIQIDGSKLLGAVNGFELQSSDNVLKSLSIVGFSQGAAVRIAGNALLPITINQVLDSDLGYGISPSNANLIGVDISDFAQFTTVRGNTITQNSSVGVRINGPTTGGAIITQNLIGLDPNGFGVVGNGTAGISLENGTTNNQIGGVNPGDGNIIANHLKGIVIANTDVRGNTMRGNLITTTGGPGIDINADGNTPNTLPPALNTVAQNGQNTPILISVTGTQVIGSLTGRANENYVVEIFSTPLAGGTRQTTALLSTVNVTLDATGYATFTAVLSTPIASNFTLVGTATSLTTGDTSEISPGVAATLAIVSGNGQSTQVNTPYAAPLVVQVFDGFGDALIDPFGPLITATSIPNGAADVLPPTASIRTSGNGIASFSVSANAFGGNPGVQMSVSPNVLPVTFALTNVAIPPPPVIPPIVLTSIPLQIVPSIRLGATDSLTIRTIGSDGNPFVFVGTLEVTTDVPTTFPATVTLTAADAGVIVISGSFPQTGVVTFLVRDPITGIQSTITTTIFEPIPPPPLPIPVSETVLAVGGRDDGLIRLFPTLPTAGNATLTRDFYPFPDSTALTTSPPPPFSPVRSSTEVVVTDVIRVPAPARTIVADIDGDGAADLISFRGLGYSSAVRVMFANGRDRTFEIFESSFTGGISVSAGDIDGDGCEDLAVTADKGGGGRVTVVSGSGIRDYPDGGAPTRLADFMGIDDDAFRGGSRSTIADVDADGIRDLIVAAGIGGGSRVAIFTGRSLFTPGAIPTRVVNDFFAFDPNLRLDGSYISAGDINADGYADIVISPGVGGGPVVSLIDGRSLTLFGITTAQFSFAVGPLDSRSGARVLVKRLDADNNADLIVALNDTINATDLKDLNGDGIVDDVLPDRQTTTSILQFNGIDLAQGQTAPRGDAFDPFSDSASFVSLYIG